MKNTEVLRHTLATLAYRTSKAVRGVPDSFPGFKASATARTPLEIVSHMADEFDGAYGEAIGKQDWKHNVPQEWSKEVDRFFASLKKFDNLLASGDALPQVLNSLFQGPVLDAVTHTGQLTILRRIAGCPMKSEGYDCADIVIGRVGIDQTPPNPEYEFD